jgi:hypothetical protein
MPGDIIRATFCKSALHGTYLSYEMLSDKIERKEKNRSRAVSNLRLLKQAHISSTSCHTLLDTVFYRKKA